MKISDICIDERDEHGRITFGLVMPGGYWVPKATVEQAWTRVRDRIPTLNWQEPQTAETLCEKTFWQALRVGRRIALGRCVKYFVDHEMLPLRVANPKKKGTRKYVRK